MSAATGDPPLSGVRVVELAGLGPAPYGAMLLGDLGAEIIRVDRVTGRGQLEEWAIGLLRGRRSIAIDLKNPRGVATMRRLIASADVFIESNRPGVAERLGIGPEVCCAADPSLIYVRMTGWGQAGPLAAAAGHDINYIAVAGALYDIGRPDSPPPPPQTYVGDAGGGGTFLVIGVLAALLERGTSGLGQVVDVSVLDGAASLTAFSHGLAAIGKWSPPRGSTIADGSAPFYDTYATSDGGYVAVGAIEPQFYANLLGRLGLPLSEYPQDDVSCWPRLREALRAAFLTRTRDEWAEHFAGVDACLSPVLQLTEAEHHPHNRSRELFVQVGGFAQPSVAPRLSRTPGTPGRPPSPTGADSIAILHDLGLSAAEIDELLESKAVRATSQAESSGER